MGDREVRLGAVLAIMFWVLGLGLVALGIVINRNGVPALGIFSAAVAAVLNVRGFFIQHANCMRDAFEVGRDYERGRRAEVHSLR